MSQKFEKLMEKVGKEYSLSSDERAKMTHVIREYVAHKPLATNSRGDTSTYRGVTSIWTSIWILFIHRPLAAALVLVLVFGTSVSYAAENALPGDALYSVKTHINEPTRLALAPLEAGLLTGRATAEVKAGIQIELAERRIEEAATLSAEGRLDENTQEQLAVAFESHADEVAKENEKVESEDSGATLELSARFETRLAAHEAVLAEVSEPSIDAEGRLSSAIRERGVAVASIRSRAEQHVAVHIGEEDTQPIAARRAEPEIMTMSLKAASAMDAATADLTLAAATEPASYDEKAAKRMRTSAEKQLKALKKTARSYLARLDASAKVEAEAQLKEAESLLDEGKDSIGDDSTAAFLAFQSSLSISEKLDVVLKASPAIAKARSRTHQEKQRESTERRVKDVQTEVRAAIPSTTKIEMKVEHGVLAPSTSSANVEVRLERGDENGGTGDRENPDSGSIKSIFKLDFGL